MDLNIYPCMCLLKYSYGRCITIMDYVKWNPLESTDVVEWTKGLTSTSCININIIANTSIKLSMQQRNYNPQGLFCNGYDLLM